MSIGDMQESLEQQYERRDQGVHDAFEAAGFLKDNGDPDRPALRTAICDLVCSHEITTEGEKKAKALIKETLVRQIFSTVIAPGDEEYTSDPVNKMVWGILLQKVKAELRTSAHGPVQRLVGAKLPGHVMCECTVGDQGKEFEAIYVTDQFSLIKTDFASGRGAALIRAGDRYAADLAMVGVRLPDHAEDVQKMVDRNMKTALNSANNIMGQLTSGSEE